MISYLIDNDRVLIGPVEFPVIPGMGTSLPSNAIELPEALPSPSDGYGWALVDGIPKQLPDRRGAIYCTATGSQQAWNSLGEIPRGFTVEPWPGEFYIWVEGAWQLDQSAQLAAKSVQILASRDGFLRDAATRIAPLQYAADLDEATEQEQAALLQWKRYSVALNRIQQQEGFPLSIVWPVSPDAV